MIESHSRSITKAISWRILATTITTAIVFVITGSITLSLLAGAVETLLKLMVYYGHERAWNSVKWGKNQ